MAFIKGFKNFANKWICNANIPQHYRAKVLKWCGVAIQDPSTTFIGHRTSFDTVCPEKIIIDDHVVITGGVCILSHFLDTSADCLTFKEGIVHICRHTFIGMNSIICNSVTIGEGSVVAAGSVVTKDVPSHEIWGGNPARFIKKCTCL